MHNSSINTGTPAPTCAPASAAKGAGVFLSLSKGTLKATYTNPNLNSTVPRTLLQTMTKEYPDKVKYFNFRYPQHVEKDKKNLKIPQFERTQEMIDHSIERSLSRTRREIKDIVDCNDFDKFATFTFDPKKHPRCNDYEYAKNKIINWLRNQQALHGSFRYLLVPERQKNGNLHFHALLGGYTGKYHATNMRGKGENQRQCYKIASWEASNGFADMEDIGNKAAVARYIGKYITKEMHPLPLTGERTPSPDISPTCVIDGSTSIVQKYGKRYFSSKGLNKPKKYYNDNLLQTLKKHNLNLKTAKTWSNDFVDITTIKKK